MVRRFLLFSLSFLIAAQAVAAAPAIKIQPHDFRRVITSTHRVFVMPTQSPQKLRETSSSKAASAVKHSFQTILFILALATIEVAKQKAKEQGALNPKAYVETTGLVPSLAEAILQDGSIWLGMAGAGFNGLALDVITKSLKVPEFKTWMGKFLTYAAKTIIILVGWEFGAQLWEEAAQNLSTNEEYELSHNIGGLLGALVLSGKKDAASVAKRNVARKMLASMGDILIKNPEMRKQWIDHTMRRRIATGHFTTLAAGLVGGGVLGTLVVPGAGTIVMAGFGLLGAAASMLVPEKQKDQITSAIRDFRIFSARQDLKMNMVEIRMSFSEKSKRKLLDVRLRLRQKLVTALFERIEHTPVAQTGNVLKEIRDVYANEVKLFHQDSRMSLLRDFFSYFIEEVRTARGSSAADLKLFIENAAIMGFKESKIIEQFQ